MPFTLVIACHHGGRLCPLHHQLKGTQVNFAQRAARPPRRKCSCAFPPGCSPQNASRTAPTPAACMPCTMALPQRRRRVGSSEKYSKLRPHRGLRFMFSPGPSRRPTPWAAASSPMARPTQLHQVRAERARQCAFAGKTGGGHAGAAVAAGVQLILFAHAVRPVCHKQAFHAFFRDGPLCARNRARSKARPFPPASGRAAGARACRIFQDIS